MTTVLSLSPTAAGAELAGRLPYEHHRGALADTVRRRWGEADGFVLFCATGIAVRVIGPLLSDKQTDPAVVVVDEAGRFVVPVAGGHGGSGADRRVSANRTSANELAQDVAALLGATAVITTATDAVEFPSLDTLPGFVTTGDVARVSRALLDAAPVSIGNPLGWPLPPAVEAATSANDESAQHRIVVTDTRLIEADHTEADADADEQHKSTVVLHPPSLVVGIGASTNAPAGAANEVLVQVLAEFGLERASIAAVATIDRRANDPVVTSLDLPVRSFSGADLAGVEVPNPSEVVAAEVGTASVAEAAALLAAGPGAELIVEKHKGATATVAVARRARPEGSVTVVGLGPGAAKHRTPEAVAAIRRAEVVIGYSFYTDQCADLTSAHQEVVASPIGAEVDRCVEAVERAARGQKVTLVCSGDPGVFAMATLVLDVAPRHGNPPVRIVPGVTASLAAGALLGAPLAHDHALISLSDLLTPWPLIERRLTAVAEADMAVALYNPRSQRRTTQLQRAKEILGVHRPPHTPVGIVVNATRPEERVLVTTLDQLDPAEVDMFSIVVIGSSTTTVINGKLVTPRGYDS